MPFSEVAPVMTAVRWVLDMMLLEWVKDERVDGCDQDRRPSRQNA
jgi:hypothetical protein